MIRKSIKVQLNMKVKQSRLMKKEKSQRIKKLMFKH